MRDGTRGLPWTGVAAVGAGVLTVLAVASCGTESGGAANAAECVDGGGTGHVPSTPDADGAAPPVGEADGGLPADGGAQPPAPAGMVSIPAGTFMIGSTNSAWSQPVTQRKVAAFFIDKTEVTAGQYAACVADHECTAAGDFPWCNGGVAGKEDHPINCVTWLQAVVYCQWAGKRLPSETEWEYAARGTDNRLFPWGSAAPTAGSNLLCWNKEDGTCAVGSYPAGASPFGVLDMAGNVTEWTSNLFTQDYASVPTTDERVARDVPWRFTPADKWDVATRSKLPPTTVMDMVGFRCAK